MASQTTSTARGGGNGARTSAPREGEAGAGAPAASAHEAMAAVIAEVGPIAKSLENAKKGYAARSIDDVMGALQPYLARHGLFLRPEVIERNPDEYVTRGGEGTVMHRTVVLVRWHFAHRSGDEVAVVMPGEGADSGDKSTAKALAMSLKYALLQTFCVPVGDPDPDADAHERATYSRPAGSNGRPRNPDDDYGAGTRPPSGGGRGGSRGSGSSGSRRPASERKQGQGSRPITDRQRRLLWGRCCDRIRDLGLVARDDDVALREAARELGEAAAAHFNAETPRDIPQSAFDGVLEYVARWEPPAEGGPPPQGGGPADDPF